MGSYSVLSLDIDYVSGFKIAYLYLSMSICDAKMTSKQSGYLPNTKETAPPRTATAIAPNQPTDRPNDQPI